MRILICTFTYPPNRDGVAAAAEAMAHGLEQRGHDTVVVTNPVLARGGSPSLIDGIEVHEFDGGTSNKREAARFQEWLISQQFEIVVCHCWHMWPTDQVTALGGRLRARKVLVSHGFTSHLVDWYRRPFWGLGPWIRNLPYVLRMPWHLREFDWVTVLAARPDFRRFFDLQVARLTGYRRISTIPNGTYPERFVGSRQAFRDEFGISERFLFLCVANYSRRKNQELAVRAFRRANLADAALVFIGSDLGEYGRQVQALDHQLARTQPAGRVFCLEGVSQEWTTAAYLACDVLVLSAKAETQPIVLIEAMAAGKPWISTDTGCVREMPGGLVVSSEEEFTNALRRLAGDAGLRARLGAEGERATREKYNWSASMTAYDALLRRIKRRSAVPNPPA